METVSECSAKLSNQEVLILLEDIQAGKGGRKKPTSQQQNLATICYETVKYLEKSPAKHQRSQDIQLFLSKLKPFQLTKAEQLQLLNHRPTTGVEIQLLIEESEERLTEEQIEQLLCIVAETLPANSDHLKESMQQN